MARRNVFRYTGEGKRHEGWFNTDNATWIAEPTRWNGSNNIGVMSGLQCGFQGLYRTAGGRWVLHHDASAEYNGPVTYEFLTDSEARDWLIKAGLDEEIETYFGELEEERGPGQPPIGSATNVRFTPAQYEALDTYAAAHGMKRAEVLRELVDNHLIGA